MAIQPDIVELMDQQQRDRQQLLLYAEQLDAMSAEARHQRETIERLAEQLASGEAQREQLLQSHAAELAGLNARREQLLQSHAAELAGLNAQREQLLESHAAELAGLNAQREQDAAALAELRRWREAMERSRTYRLMQRVAGLDRLPVIGPVMRALRRALSRGLS